MKKIVLLIALVFNIYASSDLDKDIIVLDQSRNDKVRIVFGELMQNYEEENSQAFFDLISEERFIQDYMTFSEAIDSDFRKYEIITVDTWIDKITTDGVKRYLYVKWEKRYETNDGMTQLNQKGYSRFLFDEINGQYKLIELAGNHLWGNSLSEWKEEVAQITGQEPDEVQDDDGDTIVSGGGLPDLTISVVADGSMCNVTISNIGKSATLGDIGFTGSLMPDTYYDSIPAGGSITFTAIGNCSSGILFEVDPDYMIDEEDDSNNTYLMP